METIYFVTRRTFFNSDGIDYAAAFDPTQITLYRSKSMALKEFNDWFQSYSDEDTFLSRDTLFSDYTFVFHFRNGIRIVLQLHETSVVD